MWGSGLIVYIEPANRGTHRGYLDQYFRLRKKVFCDFHGWVDPNPDGTETDFLDDEFNITIVYIDPGIDKVLGGVRLVPTTGKTLVHTAWAEMLPDPNDFRSPNIWEATRFCVEEGTSRNRRGSVVNRVTIALLLAILDLAGENGITSIIGVCETKIFEMFATFGGTAEVISQRTERDGCDVACGLWSTDESVRKGIRWARPFLGGAEPLKIEAA